MLAHGGAFQRGDSHDCGCERCCLVCDSNPAHSGWGVAVVLELNANRARGGRGLWCPRHPGGARSAAPDPAWSLVMVSPSVWRNTARPHQVDLLTVFSGRSGPAVEAHERRAPGDPRSMRQWRHWRRKCGGRSGTWSRGESTLGARFLLLSMPTSVGSAHVVPGQRALSRRLHGESAPTRERVGALPDPVRGCRTAQQGVLGWMPSRPPKCLGPSAETCL